MFPVICLSTCDFCCTHIGDHFQCVLTVEKTLQGLLAALVLLEEQGILHRVMSCPILQFYHVVPFDLLLRTSKATTVRGLGRVLKVVHHPCSDTL